MVLRRWSDRAYVDLEKGVIPTIGHETVVMEASVTKILVNRIEEEKEKENVEKIAEEKEKENVELKKMDGKN